MQLKENIDILHIAIYCAVFVVLMLQVFPYHYTVKITAPLVIWITDTLHGYILHMKCHYTKIQ